LNCKLEEEEKEEEEEEEEEDIRGGYQNFPELRSRIKSVLHISAGGR